jgi:MFS family permease
MTINRENSEPAAANPWTTHGLTSLVIFAAFLDSSLLVIAFPSIRQSFASVSTAELSWILNAYSIIFGALLVPLGWLADQLGRKRTFLSGVIIFTLASTLCGLAPSAGALIATRALQMKTRTNKVARSSNGLQCLPFSIPSRIPAPL